MTPTDLTTRRQALALSPAQLSALLGVDRRTIDRWERGERAIPPYLWRALRDLERERA